MFQFEYDREQAIYPAETNDSQFIPSTRIKRLIQRRDYLHKSGKRNVYADNPEFLIYHWSGESEAFSPATGEQAKAEDKRINIGDHNCRVDNGQAFPFSDQMPSKVNGFEYSWDNWAEDYAFFLDHNPAEIFPYEKVVGEFHWQLDEARLYKYPEEVRNEGFEARALGAGGFSFTHTCPDLSIGLSLGLNGLLDKTKHYQQLYQECGNEASYQYLLASEKVILAVIRYFKRYAERALELYQQEQDPQRKACYLEVYENTQHLHCSAPQTFKQAVQWIQLYQICERMYGHGNGYGRLDLLLAPFYEADKQKGLIDRDEAREYIAELYLKYGGNYFSYGGRNQALKDATSEISWIGVEAYDMVGGYNQLGVMWHSDINPEFWRYACDVVARHGCGSPTLINYDVIRASNLRSGYAPEDCWNISYSGCQWYCSVGNEYSDHDLNSFVIIQPMQRALERACQSGVEEFEDFWILYHEEIDKTADALVRFKNKTYEWHNKVWPEMLTSFCMHGPIENGRDVTDIRAVNNNYTSVNVLGMPNVIDSLYAINELVFKAKAYSLSQVLEAVESDWERDEIMRQRFLNCPKFGNDHDEIDAFGVRLCEHIREVLESKRNIKGFNFRPSLFQYMGHTYAGQVLGATPDGRKRDEFIAHGMNPQHGRNSEGISATINSLCKIDFTRYQGGSLQIELQPNCMETAENRGELVNTFADIYFTKGGVQINLNVIDLQQLEAAYHDPSNPAYQDIVVKVTGYSAHFVLLDKQFQKEFINRVNYQNFS